MVELIAKPEDLTSPDAERRFWQKAILVASVIEEPVAATVRGIQIAIQPTHVEQIALQHAEAVAESPPRSALTSVINLPMIRVPGRGQR